MIIYNFFGGDDDEYFATKREAIAAARKLANNPNWDFGDIEIERHEFVPYTKRNMLYILNNQGGGWSARRETVAIVHPPRKNS